MNTKKAPLLESRVEVINKLKTDEFDVLIVGGGITGAGIARDAVLRGYSVALIEKNDFGSGTSSGSSKLVHAGLRYVAQKEFKLVRQASKERKKILDMAPHLTQPVQFLVPLYSDLKTTKSKIRLGVWLYDLLANFRNHTFHKIMNSKKGRELLPTPLREESFEGVALYGDGQMDDARLTLDVILSAEEHGALVLNYCQAEAFNDNSQEKIQEATVIDKLTKNRFILKAKSIIIACGHWTDEIVQGIDSSAIKRIRPTKGIHVITRRFYDNNRAVVVPMEDGRIMFVIPFDKYQLIGTTDTDYSGDYENVPVTEEDVDYIINGINFIFPGILRKEDIVSAYSGLRPLIYSVTAKSEGQISREHEIFEIKPRILAIAGGKYTTYRSMAKEVIDSLSRILEKKGKCKTDKVPLYGWISTKRKHWDSWVIIALENLTIRHQLPEDVAKHLLRYGKNYQKICAEITLQPKLKERISDNRPYIFAELDYFIKYEKAVSLRDVMLRRTQIQLSEEQGLDCIETISEHMGQLLNWSSQKIRKEIEDYKNNLVWKA